MNAKSHPAGRRGAGLPRPPARHRGADRALAHPPPGRRRASGPGCAASRRRRACEIGGVAIEGVQTKGAMATDMALSATGLRQVPRPARRARHHPDRAALADRASRSGRTTGGTCSNSFAILLNYTELALITVGLTYVIAAGDIDLSVGAVLALAGSDRGLFPEGARRRPGDRGGDRPARRHVPPGWSTRRHGRLQAAGLHRHARHVLHRPRRSPPGSSPASSSPAGPRATT